MNIFERVRLSGKCPPSLICLDSDIDFETKAVNVVDANELYLSFETTVPDDFQKLLEVRWRLGISTKNGGTWCRNDVLFVENLEEIRISVRSSIDVRRRSLGQIFRSYLSIGLTESDFSIQADLWSVRTKRHILRKVYDALGWSVLVIRCKMRIPYRFRSEV